MERKKNEIKKMKGQNPPKESSLLKCDGYKVRDIKLYIFLLTLQHKNRRKE